jgi:hypothetical protein
MHSRLWWPDIAMVTIAAIIVTISFVRSEERPYLPSALLTYGLFLPLSAAGFGLGSGVGLGEIWPQAMFVFLVHFCWATFFAMLALFFVRFFPTSLGGFSLTGSVLVILISVVVSFTGFGTWAMQRTGLATPVPPTATITLAAPTQFSTNVPTAIDAATPIGVPASTVTRTPLLTQTSRPTLPPTSTSTSTVTAEPTPIIAIIRASEGGGAFIREQPGGLVLKTLGNGATVTIIPNDFQEFNRVTWVHVFVVIDGERIEGWMLQSVLQTATPIADWQPSATPAVTQTP